VQAKTARLVGHFCSRVRIQLNSGFGARGRVERGNGRGGERGALFMSGNRLWSMIG